MALAVAWLAFGAACGPSPTPAGPPLRPPPEPPSEMQWAGSPLAPLARELAGAAEAALAGEPLDSERLEMREATGPLVDDARGRPEGHLEPIALLIRAEARVGEHWLALAWWLDARDARVIQLERRDAPASSTAAPKGLERATRDAIEALREGELPVWRPDMAPHLPPPPSDGQLAGLQELAAGEVEEIRVHDVALLGHGEDGARWLLELSIVEVTEDRIVLDGDPLLTVVPAPG